MKNIRHFAFDRPDHIAVQKYYIGGDFSVDAAALADNYDVGLDFSGDAAVDLNGMVGFDIAVQLTSRADNCRALFVFRICKCEHE